MPSNTRSDSLPYAAAAVSNPVLRVMVLGGTGFLGRHAVQALQADGAQVLIGTRHPDRHAARHPAGSLLAVRFEQLLTPGDWHPLLLGIDVVVNCVGILRQRPRESYDDVHHRAPAALAQACVALNTRLIHTSALALHEGAKSRFLSSKLRGEQAIAATDADYCLLRPSLLDGEGGFGASWLRALARSPVQFIPRGARGAHTGIAAMQVTDLGLAYAALAKLPSLRQHRQVELGGLHAFDYAEYLRVLRARHTGSTAWQITLPNWAARVGAHVCDVLHFSPFSYGHWILLQRANVPNPNRLPELLGRAPHAIHRPPPQHAPLACEL